MGAEELRAALERHPDGVVVVVWAVPGASRTEVAGLHGDALRVRVSAPPEGGRANDAIAAALADRLEVRRVRLLEGRRSRRKRFLAAGVSVAEAARRLAP